MPSESLLLVQSSTSVVVRRDGVLIGRETTRGGTPVDKPINLHGMDEKTWIAAALAKYGFDRAVDGKGCWGFEIDPGTMPQLDFVNLRGEGAFIASGVKIPPGAKLIKAYSD